MSATYSANERVVVLCGDKFRECIAIPIGNDVTVKLDESEIVVVFGGARFHKRPVPGRMDDVSYVLIDPSQEHAAQIVGVAETDRYDESRPGEFYPL